MSLILKVDENGIERYEQETNIDNIEQVVIQPPTTEERIELLQNAVDFILMNY